MDTKTRERLALDFVAGVREGDLSRMRAALDPAATWTVPGSTAISGLADGADEIVDRAAAVAGGGVSVELEQVLTGLDSTAVLLHNTGRRGERVLDEQVAIVFTFTDDLIATATNLISDVAGLDAFFAAGR